MKESERRRYTAKAIKGYRKQKEIISLLLCDYRSPAHFTQAACWSVTAVSSARRWGPVRAGGWWGHLCPHRAQTRAPRGTEQSVLVCAGPRLAVLKSTPGEEGPALTQSGEEAALSPAPFGSARQVLRRATRPCPPE